ncbi:MAG: hypothetical protein WDW36_007471, partial [Sanguina aurantia]
PSLASGRVKSAIPGLSRALSAKISLYRSSESARADLRQRISSSAAHARADAAALGARLSEIDFVRSNRSSLVAIPNATLQQVQDSRCGTPMPPGALHSLPRFLYPTNHQRGERSRSPSPGPERTPPQPSSTTPVSRRPRSSGGGAAGAVHFAASGGGGGGGAHGVRATPAPTGAGDSGSMPLGSGSLGSMPAGWALTALPDDPRVGVFTPLPPTPETAAVLGGGGGGRERRGGNSGTDLGQAQGERLGGGGVPAVDGGLGRPSAGRGCGRRSEKLGRRGGSGEDAVDCADRTAGVGRPDYLDGFRIHTEERRTHAEGVKDRRLELQEDEAAAAVELVASRIRAREEVKRAAQKGAAEVEHRRRQLAWLGYIGVAHKLSFLRQQLQDDRSVRGVRELRKRAAVRIAAWYKDVLVRRRTRGLVQLLLKLNHLLTPHMASAAAAARGRAARRLLHFMSHCETSNLAVVAIRKFKAAILHLQSEWRLMLMVRHTQREILYNALRRFERGLLHRNLKAEKNALTGKGGKHVSIMPSSPTAPASVIGRGPPHSVRLDSSRRVTRPPAPGSRPARGTSAAGMASSSGTGPSATQASRNSIVRQNSAAGRGRETSAGGAHQGQSRSPSPNHSYMGGGVALEKQGIIRRSQAGEEERSRSLHAGRPQTAQSFVSAAPTPSHTRPLAALLAPDYDPFLDAHLAEHREPLPDAIVRALVGDALCKQRRAFFVRLDAYRQAKAVFLKKRPIEELRLRLLRDAGIHTSSETPEPIRPRMLSLLPRFRLKLLLRDGMMMLNDSLREESDAAAKLTSLLADAGLAPVGPVSSPSASPKIAQDRVKEVATQASNRVSEAAQQAGHAVQHLGDRVAETVTGTHHAASQTATQAGNAAQEHTQAAGHSLGEAAQKASHAAGNVTVLSLQHSVTAGHPLLVRVAQEDPSGRQGFGAGDASAPMGNRDDTGFGSGGGGVDQQQQDAGMGSGGGGYGLGKTNTGFGSGGGLGSGQQTDTGFGSGGGGGFGSAQQGSGFGSGQQTDPGSGSGGAAGFGSSQQQSDTGFGSGGGMVGSGQQQDAGIGAGDSGFGSGQRTDAGFGSGAGGAAGGIGGMMSGLGGGNVADNQNTGSGSGAGGQMGDVAGQQVPGGVGGMGSGGGLMGGANAANPAGEPSTHMGGCMAGIGNVAEKAAHFLGLDKRA